MNQMGSSIEITAQGLKTPSAGSDKDTDQPSLGFVELLGSCCEQIVPITSDETVKFKFGGKSCELELSVEQESSSESDCKIDCAILARKLSMGQAEQGDAAVNPEQANGKDQVAETGLESKATPDLTQAGQSAIQAQAQFPLTEDALIADAEAKKKAKSAGETGFKHSLTEIETANSVTLPLSISTLDEAIFPGSDVAWERLTVLSPQEAISDDQQSFIFKVAARLKQLKSMGTMTASSHEDSISALSDRQGLQAGDASRAAAPVPEAAQQGMQVSERVMRYEDLANRFSEQLLSMVKENQKAMKITIDPPSLGRITVLCREENSAMVVEIHSQNGAVRDLIARQEDAIRRMMEDHEVDLGKFDVLMDHGTAERHEQRQLGADRREMRDQASGIQPASKESGEPREESAILKRKTATWIA